MIEKLNELQLILDLAQRFDVRPNLGIRIKLSSHGSGKWEESGGYQSKFGLNSAEIIETMKIVEKEGYTDCIKLIHFHLGSQITNIRKIKNGLREASNFYVQMHKNGFKVEFVDIGGGLVVD